MRKIFGALFLAALCLLTTSKFALAQGGVS
jgi:hypothetical protein